MTQGVRREFAGVYTLPPLILHPFTESAATVRLLESARASISTLRDGEDREGLLDRQLVESRFTELRMLFYVGKDVCRWLDQCGDHCGRQPELAADPVPVQSFAQLLIEQTPADVAAKLRGWGVVEYARIFSRSIGLYNQFREPPDAEILQPGYLRSYHRYADFAYAAWRELAKAPRLPAESFPFVLYASGEYARMLEDEWREF
jgi:hypothetical protein